MHRDSMSAKYTRLPYVHTADSVQIRPRCQHPRVIDGMEQVCLAAELTVASLCSARLRPEPRRCRPGRRCGGGRTRS